LKIVIGSRLLCAEVGGADEQRLLFAAIGDLDLIRSALAAHHLAGVAVEAGVEPTLPRRGIQVEMDLLPGSELLYRTLGW